MDKRVLINPFKVCLLAVCLQTSYAAAVSEAAIVNADYESRKTVLFSTQRLINSWDKRDVEKQDETGY